jgi:tRNA A22 N-methylase
LKGNHYDHERKLISPFLHHLSNKQIQNPIKNQNHKSSQQRSNLKEMRKQKNKHPKKVANFK